MTKYLLLAPSLIAYAMKILMSVAIYTYIIAMYPIAWIWGVGFKKYHSDAVYVAFKLGDEK